MVPVPLQLGRLSMVIRFTDDLIIFIQSDGRAVESARQERSPFTVMTSSGPEKVLGQQSQGYEPGMPQIEEIPEWLREALLQGSHVFMDRNDYVRLPEEVRRHADIIA